jgi:(2Fe-2S) ferredoxin
MMPEELLQWAAEEREKQAAFKHNIRVCVAGGCLSTGSDRVKAALQAEDEARGLNGTCQVKGVGCLGLCSMGPLIKVDDHYCRHVSPEDAAEIMDRLGDRPLERLHISSEMPAITARSCGICPFSHLIASAKACDQIMAVRIPATAVKLRRLMNLAQIVQSHALSFFHLSLPDLVLGMDADPSERNVFGLMRKYPELARDGIRLRQFGQSTIEWLGSKRVQPTWVVPGGVSAPLQVAVLQTARLPGGHVPRRPAGAAEHHRPLRHAQGGSGVGRIPGRGSPRRAELLLLPLRTADRDCLLAGEHPADH